MRPEYNGVKYYGPGDMSIGINFERGAQILDAFDEEKKYNDINEIIELYNIYQIMRSKEIKPEFTRQYMAKAEKGMRITALFFRAINDESIQTDYDKVCFDYLDDFWILFEKFHLYDRISSLVFDNMLHQPETALFQVLQQRETVNHFDEPLACFMRESEQTARLIVSIFLEKRNSDVKYFIPSSLKANEYEEIIARQIIDSDFSNIGVLQLIVNSQSSKECPISDRLRLSAERKIKELSNTQKNEMKITFGIEVCFGDNPDIVSVKQLNPMEYRVTYDRNWIWDNLDYPTLLNNSIYLFGYVDRCYRSSFVQIESELGVFEKSLGVQGVREYKTGISFQMTQQKSSAELQAYSSILREHNIYIEDLIQWFFTEYLKNEFKIDGFIINMPSRESTALEKCRILAAEMDGVLKQYRMYVTDHCIDRELLEMSSIPVSFQGIPSQIDQKYAYAANENIKREQFLMFSNQCMLSYIPGHEEARSFYEMLRKNQVKMSDYPEWECRHLEWFRNRNTIIIDQEGNIQLNVPRVQLLKDLYEHEVICVSYYKDKDMIKQLVLSGDLQYGSTLFSVPEQKYLNYVLNKSEYSNGHDLRNRYIHGTYSMDKSQQEYDYIWLLKIMILTVLKINEECCLANPE